MRRQQSQARAAQLQTFNPGHGPCAPAPRRPLQTGPTLCAIPSQLPRGKSHSQQHGPCPQRLRQKQKPPLPLEKASQTWAAEKARVAILNASRGRGESEKKGHRKAGPADHEESPELPLTPRSRPERRKFLTSKAISGLRTSRSKFLENRPCGGQTLTGHRLWAIGVCFKGKPDPSCPTV